MDTAAKVSLREITRENLHDILNLSVSKNQEGLVASNAKSIAEAYFADDAWFRAIYAGETPVGFIMLCFRRFLRRQSISCGA